MGVVCKRTQSRDFTRQQLQQFSSSSPQTMMKTSGSSRLAYATLLLITTSFGKLLLLALIGFNVFLYPCTQAYERKAETNHRMNRYRIQNVLECILV